MGGKESKAFPISSEEAMKRATEAERRRLQESFRRLSSASSSSLLSRPLFLRHVMGDCVPIPLAEAVFAACGGKGNNGVSGGVAFKDVLTLLVLITRGTREEKVKFIFGLLSSENGHVVDRTDLIRFLREFEPHFDYNHIAALFDEGDKASFEQFNRWVEGHSEALSLTQWLLEPNANLSLINKFDTPTFYQTLSGVTHLEEQEIIELEKRFWTLAGNSGSGQIDRDVILSLVSPPLPAALVNSFFSAFDENLDGHIDFKELSCGVSAACRGPDMERNKFCFKIFDGDRDGVLKRSELELMAKCLVEVMSQVTPASSSLPTVEERERELLSGLRTDEENVMTQEEYLVWTVDNQFPQEFSKLIFQLCHVVLGLRPLTRKDEGQIVKGWLERESGAPLTVGSLWYLVSMDWWNSWNSYVSYQDSPSSSSRTSPGDLISKRNSRKLPSIDSTLAMDGNKTVVGTSYQHIGEAAQHSASTQSSGSLGRKSSATTDSGSGNGSGGGGAGSRGSSRLTTPSGSPHSSRKNLVSAPPPRPGLIDNSSLVLTQSRGLTALTSLTAEGGRLRGSSQSFQQSRQQQQSPVRGRDFELLPERLWKALAQWYGGGSPALPRQVIRNKEGHVELELNPLSIRLFKHQTVSSRLSAQGSTAGSAMAAAAGQPPTLAGCYSAAAGATMAGGPYGGNLSAAGPSTTTRRYHAYQAAFSRRTSVRQVQEFLCQRLHVKSEDLRLWHLGEDSNSQDLKLLEEESTVLEDVGFKDEDGLLVEVRSRDGTWPEEISSLVSRSSGFTPAVGGTSSVRGITGLNNLGNTCYMNTSLQCVSNTKILAEYFINNCHLFEMNRTNPFGMKGHVAKRFGDLVRDMWSSQAKTIAPIKLRWTIGRYRPQFAGFQQHDAQELLAFLLDGLHEDLNRVTDKPYVELKDSDGRPDVEVAKEAWENHVLRNRSVIVDLFHGQLKSKVTCKVCGHESVRFDPFSILSLPLPMESSVHLEVIVIRQDGSVPVKYGLTLDTESARFSSIKARLSRLCKVLPQNLVLVDIVQAQFRSIPAEEQTLKGLNGSCIYAYEFREVETNGRKPRNDNGGSNGNHIQQQTFSDIQRTSPTTAHQGNEVSQRTSSSSPPHKRVTGSGSICMNGLTSCFKSSRDPPASVINEMSQLDSSSKRPSAVVVPPDSPKSDKDALLANGYLPAGSGHRNADTLVLPAQQSVSRGHSRQSSAQSRELSLGSSPGDIADCQHKGVVVALHRKMMPQEVYFLSMEKYRPVLFGLPVMVSCSEETTLQELYKTVWTQVARLVSPLPPRDSAHNHATDCDDSLRYEYPFTLKLVQKEGAWCARCPWQRFCRGCPLPCSSTDNFNFASSYLAIDWDQTALHLRYLSAQERAFREDPSVSSSLRAASEPITLQKCLEAFTREEELGEDEKYYCASCKTHQLAIKKLQIWRLPPVLIIQLKRFHFLNGRWIKSHKIVDFPLRHLDPTDFLAAVPAATLKRYQSNVKRDKTLVNTTIQEASEPNSLEDDDSGVSTDQRDTVDMAQVPSRAGSLALDVAAVLDSVDGDSLEDVFDRQSSLEEFATAASTAECLISRKRIESTSLQSYPIRDDDLQDFHEHALVKGKNSLDVAYNLYSMVCHSGVLGGGHYISYGKSKTGKWFCQNDSACKEIPEEQMDKPTAYMLFYEREGLSVSDYLPRVEKSQLPDTRELDEELDTDFKKQCSVM